MLSSSDSGVVSAYEADAGCYQVIAALFSLGEATVKRWIWRQRDGDLRPSAEGRRQPVGDGGDREPEPVRAGVWLLFPDFALQHRLEPDLRWYVEIVGFWTERYLERKLAAYRAAAIDNLILCVADDLSCRETDLPVGANIIRYHRHVDPRSVLSLIDPSPTEDLRATDFPVGLRRG